ncbi:MAG: terminase small subunit [Planctomycetota bacterium]|jgi:phage terminase Nu1 subunit (DNA packaging protein)
MAGAEGKLVNRSELAAIFGCSVNTIDAQVRRGMPYVRRSAGRGGGIAGWLFDTAACIHWREERRAAEAAEVGKTEKLEEARRRLVVAQAALEELKLEELRGEVVRVDVVAEVLAEVLGAVRSKVLALETKLTPRIPAIKNRPTARRLVQEAVEEVLSELCDSDSLTRESGRRGRKTKSGASADDSREPAATAEAHAKRVGRPKKTAKRRGKRRAG